MGYVTVNFLGEQYQVSETINEFLHYDELLTPVRVKMLKSLSQDIKRDSRSMTFGDETPDHVDRNARAYQKLMEECADVLVKKLFALGVYDVTVNDLLATSTAIADLNDMKMKILQTMVGEGRKYVDMKNRGMEHAYRSAASNITGSGVMVFSSSITTLLIHSVVERGILMSQAKQADREYEEAVRAINASTRRALDTMVSEVMVKQYYPALMDILMDFNTKITSAFLVELAQHGKFDFASIQNYNMTKAEQMLTNIRHVPDKVAFLKQAFNTCPFSLDVYEKCLEYGLLDRDTFKTAAYFGFADALAEKMDVYINKHLKDKSAIAPIISILAEHRNTSETGIWRRIYKDTIDAVESAYRKFDRAIKNQSSLDGFVREYISPNMAFVAKQTQNNVEQLIAKKITAVISENRYLEFIEMGLLSAERIRKDGSSATSLCDINNEYCVSLTVCVMAYIEEANRRLKCYEESKAQFDQELQTMKDELKALNADREKLGFFAFSKKKELDLAIGSKTKQIAEYEKNHESKKLWTIFERMYS